MTKMPFFVGNPRAYGLWMLAFTCTACSSDGRMQGGDMFDASLHDAGEQRDASDLPLSDAAANGEDSGVPSDGSVDDAAVVPWDPGPMPWKRVPENEVRETCRLDPEALKAADALLQRPWAVVRYGKLCHQYMAEGMKTREAWSVTKTLGALVLGMLAYETRDLPNSGRKTGPLSDMDRVDHWLDSFNYNQDAQIGHVLGMIAHNQNLAYGQRVMEYDIVGSVQINSLSTIMNRAIAQDPGRLGKDLDQFTQHFLFDKLGHAHSTWRAGNAEKPLGLGWSTDVYDMAKVGLLMLRGGIWEGERLLDEEWVYRMTHPSFEDANTGYGYLTWLNASSGWTVGLADAPELSVPVLPGPCAPVSLYKEHPHGLSEAPNCLYPVSCSQTYDVGVWQALGLLGQVIQGHPGLDLVVVGMDLTSNALTAESLLSGERNPAAKLWDALKPAVINADPTFQGDATAFCAAYGSNSYAPDLPK